MTSTAPKDASQGRARANRPATIDSTAHTIDHPEARFEIASAIGFISPPPEECQLTPPFFNSGLILRPAWGGR